MCKRYTSEAQLAGEGAYESQTLRLDLNERGRIPNARPARISAPWWALWLIWPLIALVKWSTPLAAAASAAIAGSLGATGAPIAALLLIAAGIILLRRN